MPAAPLQTARPRPARKQRSRWQVPRVTRAPCLHRHRPFALQRRRALLLTARSGSHHQVVLSTARVSLSSAIMPQCSLVHHKSPGATSAPPCYFGRSNLSSSLLLWRRLICLALAYEAWPWKGSAFTYARELIARAARALSIRDTHACARVRVAVAQLATSASARQWRGHSARQWWGHT